MEDQERREPDASNETATITNESAEWLRRNICSCHKADHEYYCPVHDLDMAILTERRMAVDEIRERLNEEPGEWVIDDYGRVMPEECLRAILDEIGGSR